MYYRHLNKMEQQKGRKAPKVEMARLMLLDARLPNKY